MPGIFHASQFFFHASHFCRASSLRAQRQAGERAGLLAEAGAGRGGAQAAAQEDAQDAAAGEGIHGAGPGAFAGLPGLHGAGPGAFAGLPASAAAAAAASSLGADLGALEAPKTVGAAAARVPAAAAPPSGSATL